MTSIASRRPGLRRSTAVTSLLAFALFTIGCSPDSSDTSAAGTEVPTGTDEAAPEDVEVTLAQSRFEPVELAVATDDVVRFVNTDPFAHTVTAAPDAGSDFDSGDMGQDDVFEISFDEPGSYSYFCEIHPTMRGVIEVG